MRIVVSGTHASGKSTLVSDFAARHPGFQVLPDPFELIDEAWDRPGPGMFAAQLHLAAERLAGADASARLIAERGPLDFVAYLLALDALSAFSGSRELLGRSTAIARDAMAHVDLLVVLPLAARDPIRPGADEDLELRAMMNDMLLELIDDGDLVGSHTTVVELAGDPHRRLAALEDAVFGTAPAAQSPTG